MAFSPHDDYLKVQSKSSEVGDTLGCLCVSDTGCWMLSVPGVVISFSLHGFCCLVFSWDTLGNASANSCSKAHQWQLALQIASQARDGSFDVICMYGIYLSWILTLRCFLGRLLVVQYVSIIPTQIDFVFWVRSCLLRHSTFEKGLELLTLKTNVVFLKVSGRRLSKPTLHTGKRDIIKFLWPRTGLP